MSDEIWAALRRMDRFLYARLEDRFGQCPACGLNATSVALWDSAAYAVCQCCRTRWLAGNKILFPLTVQRRESDEPDLLWESDDAEEEQYVMLTWLAQFTDLTSSQNGDAMSDAPAAPSPAPVSFSIDPRVLQEILEGRKTHVLLPRSSPTERIGLVDVIIRDQHQHPQIERHPISGKRFVQPLGVWDRIRDQVIDPARGTKVNDLFGSPRMENSFDDLRAIVQLLYRAVDERAALEKQLRKFDQLANLFAMPATTTTEA